eukprot:8027812-Heterocapsa_arctica.AAC.1
MVLPRREPPPEPTYPPPKVSQWSSPARAHFEAKARREAHEAESALRVPGPRIWTTAAMPGDTPVVTPDASPAEDVTPEAGPGNRT